MVTTMPRPTNPRIAGPAQEKSGSESNFFSSLEMEDLGGELHAAVRALAAPPGRGQENGVVVWESIRASLVHNVGATRIDVYKTRKWTIGDRPHFLVRSIIIRSQPPVVLYSTLARAAQARAISEIDPSASMGKRSRIWSRRCARAVSSSDMA